MKLKKYNLFEVWSGPDDDAYDADDENLYGRPNYNKFEEEEEELGSEEEEELNDSQIEDMNHLCYLLRQMFRDVDQSINVENDKLDILINVYFNENEQLNNIVDIFKIARKIKKEVLTMYESSFEIWYTKPDKNGDSDVIITFEFNYDDGTKKNKHYGYSSDYNNNSLWNDRYPF